MIGFGYDVHRLAAGESLVLGGVPIESSFGTVAHSDGDVVLHALCDALLGAAGLGDIGEHFPDTDPRWKNAPSSVFVAHVCELLTKSGFSIVNADIALTLEAPKILPYKQRMRTGIAQMLSLPVERVNIKATTAEKLGFIGRGEGVACYCVTEVRESH
jgi:2-C-methyl-D-erythritol 2,4-cyclodiphosphate synthase